MQPCPARGDWYMAMLGRRASTFSEYAGSAWAEADGRDFALFSEKIRGGEAVKILGMSVRKVLICASIVAGIVVSTPAIARAGGYFNSINARFYTSYVHYSISYSVLDDSGYCVKDEYGFY